MAPNRRVGAAAVRTIGVIAGTIASSIGKASVAPRPRRTVRRDNACFVMNIGCSLSFTLPGSLTGRRDAFVTGALDPHLEWYAPDDAQHNGREAVAVTLGVTGNRAHGGHVRRAQAAAQGIGQQPLGQRLHEDPGSRTSAALSSVTPLIAVPSTSCPEASIGVPRVPPSRVRHAPIASKFSSARPAGSIMR